MSDRDELLALAGALRAHLLDRLAAGHVVEPRDAAHEVVAVEPTAEEDEAPAPAAPPMAAHAWSRMAETARASTRPSWMTELEWIREELGDCRRCGLCEGRRHIVFGVGDPDADLMVIGEGPGEQEDLKGEPFVGPAGQMLDRMLENVLGLPRPRVYIANVVKCRPPGNRNPEPEEAAVCKPFLERQIAAVRPKVILLLGGVALQYLMGVKGITSKRGQELRYGDAEIPVIPTFHPAYLLRKPEDKRLTFEDLKLVRRRYDELGGRR